MWLLWLAASVGGLHIRSPHYGASVLVDRQPVGRVPLKPLELPAGLHLVELRAGSETRWTRLVYVAPGSVVVVDARWQGEVATAADGEALQERKGPTYAVQGQVGVEAATLGDGADIDAVFGARVDGEGVLTEAVDAELSVRGRGDVSGAPVLVGGQTADLVDDAVRLETATLRADPGAWRLSGGRMYALGPGVRAFTLDGGRAAYLSDGLRLRASGGRQGGPEPAGDGGWLAHLGGGWGESARLDAWYAGTLHVDGGLRAGMDGLLVRADGRTVGTALAAAGARVDHHLGWAHTGVRRGVASPFEPPTPPLAWVRDVDGYEARVGGEWGDVRGWWGATRSISARGRWRFLSAAGSWVQRDPLLRARGGLAVDRSWRWGRWRTGGRAGATWLHAGGADRWLPDGGADLEVAVVGTLSVRARAAVAAVHPAVHPAGGPLAYGGLEVRVR